MLVELLLLFRFSHHVVNALAFVFAAIALALGRLFVVIVVDIVVVNAEKIIRVLAIIKASRSSITIAILVVSTTTTCRRYDAINIVVAINIGTIVVIAVVPTIVVVFVNNIFMIIILATFTLTLITSCSFQIVIIVISISYRNFFYDGCRIH